MESTQTVYKIQHRLKSYPKASQWETYPESLSENGAIDRCNKWQETTRAKEFRVVKITTVTSITITPINL